MSCLKSIRWSNKEMWMASYHWERAFKTNNTIECAWPIYE